MTAPGRAISVRARQRGELGGPAKGLRHAWRGVQVPVPAVQAAAAGVASLPVEERAHRLRQQTDCGHPESGTTSGLVAYLDGEPVGWCAVEPRTAYGLLRNTRVPWAGRDGGQDRRRRLGGDLLAHPRGFPRRGVSRALARATVDFARERGARATRGLPDDHPART